MAKLLLGIDFGTSTNFVTKYDFKKKDAVPVANMTNYHGNNILDNCIYIAEQGKYTIGSRNKQHSEPENFFEDVKRFITDDNWNKEIPNLNNKKFSAKSIAEMVFETIRKKVEENENQKVDGVVITVPYAYGKKYRDRLREASENAGLTVLKLIEEPVAAAISFGLFSDKVQNNQKEKICIFDLGGGTFDITIFHFEKSNSQNANIEVLNTDGVEKLGGTTIDELLASKFLNWIGIEYSDLPNEKERTKLQTMLNSIAKKTKEELSDGETDIYETLSINGKNYILEKEEVTVDEFNSWLKDNNILGQIEDALERVIYDINLEPEDIDRIILVGGTSNIPIIKQLVEDFFGKKTESKKALGELVGHGAGIRAGFSEDKSLDYQITLKTSKNIGIAQGNRFKTILSKNMKYGEASAKIPLSLRNKNDNLVVSFYEGDSPRIEDCEKIGKVTINGTEFKNRKIYLSLTREEKSGEIRCYFYDNNKNLVSKIDLEDI